MSQSFFTLLLILVAPILNANTFEDGVKAYEKAEYEQASKIFFELSEKTPNNPTLLYNLGLSTYNQDRKGLALGLWRKAQHISPRPEHTQAIRFVEAELGMGQGDSEYLESGSQWISHQPLDLWLGLSLLTTFLIGWFSVTFFAKRKLPLLAWPPWIFLLVPFWLLFSTITVWQGLQTLETFGTVVYQDVSTRTSPSLGSPTLTGLDEGERVEVIKTHENWIQVRSVSGIPGWVLAEKVIQEEGS